MVEPETPPTTRSRVALGLALGLLAGLLVKELELPSLLSIYWDGSFLATAAMAAGGLLATTRLRKLLAIGTALLAVLWLLVAWTPLTFWLGRGLPRRDALARADAVYVLGSGLQEDGELSTLAMSRLLHGLELLGEGWAPRLILPELPEPHRRYREAACEVMQSLGLTQEVLTVGPVRDTHDEAVAVAALAKDFGFGPIIVVTSPAHSRRASAALESQGVRVLSSPSQQTLFDYENLDGNGGDQRLRAFSYIAHEYVGLAYYRLRGWITS